MTPLRLVLGSIIVVISVPVLNILNLQIWPLPGGFIPVLG